MRQSGQLVGIHLDVQNGRCGGCKELANGPLQFVRVPGGETCHAASAGKGGEIHVRKLGPSEGGQAGLLHLQMDEPPFAVVEDNDLDWKAVLDRGHELAEQHREAAVPASRDDLPGSVERLHAVRLTERRTDSSIVERGEDALAPGLTNPVPRPESDLPSIHHEDGIGLGKIAENARECRRMNPAFASTEVGPLVQHAVPAVACLCNLLEESAVSLGGDLGQKGSEGRADRADDSKLDLGASTVHESALVDLDNVPSAREKLRIRVIGAEHQDQIRLLQGVYSG